MELKDALENPSSLINAVKVGENRWRGIDEEAIEYVLGIVMAIAGWKAGKYDLVVKSPWRLPRRRRLSSRTRSFQSKC